MLQKRLLALVGVVAIIATACGGSQATQAPAASASPGASVEPGASPSAGEGNLAADQTLRLYLAGADPRSFQPQAVSGSEEIAVIAATNRGLLYVDEKLALVPAGATELPKVNADATEFTFTLRDDVKYSNGDPVVAEDYVRGMKILADPRNAFDYGYEMCWVEGADAVMGADFGCQGTTPDVTDNALIDGLLDKLGVTAPDDHTLVIKLARPASFFPNIMAMWLTTPVHKDATKFAEAADFITSGPFKFESWTHNSEIVLVPDENWYGTKPTLQRIELKIGGDPEAATASYEQGDLDIVEVPGTSARRVFDDPALKPEVVDAGQLGVVYYDFAMCDQPSKAGTCPTSDATASGRSPTENLNFRKAMTQAINKQELIDLTYAGLYVPGTGPVMPGIPGGWPDDYDPYKFDVAAANASMATALQELGVKDTVGPDAGPPDGKVTVLDLGKLKFGYNCDAGHTPRVIYLAGAWRQNLGFSESQFDISCTDFGVFRTERRAGNIYHISRNGWGADFPHADNQLRDLFACGAGNNNSHYCNPTFDDLLNKGAAEPDPAKSNEIYKQAQRLLVDDAPVYFIGYELTRNLVKPYVTGVTQTGNDYENLGDVFYENYKILEH
jgi:oligopeptide transport system substrate-binding protein